jgi:hypothetical protein
MYFLDVKIPATNRFSKCETCERLKAMVNTGNIESGHNFTNEELEKLQNDKVCDQKTITNYYTDLFQG